MKKFLILPCIAVLAACSSNNETATVPVQPQPMVKPMVEDKKPTTPTVEEKQPENKEKQPEKKPEAKSEDKPKPVAPPTSLSSTPAPVVPVPPPTVTTQEPPKIEGSTAAITEVAKNLVPPQKADGTLGLPPGEDPDLKNESVKLYKVTDKNRKKFAVYMLDLTKFGLKYQKFGPVYDESTKQGISPGTLEGYISTGIHYKPDDNKAFSATYDGYAIGSYNDKEAMSRLAANLKWEAGEKSLTITASDSLVATGANGELVPNNKLNFTKEMTWDSTNKYFSGADSKGYLYGDAAQEVGGTFKQQIGDNEVYQGGFGATREEQ